MGQVPTSHSRFNHSRDTRFPGPGVSFEQKSPPIRLFLNGSLKGMMLCCIQGRSVIGLPVHITFVSLKMRTTISRALGYDFLPAPKYVFDLFSRTGKRSLIRSYTGTIRFKRENANPGFGKLGYDPNCEGCVGRRRDDRSVLPGIDWSGMSTRNKSDQYRET